MGLTVRRVLGQDLLIQLRVVLFLPVKGRSRQFGLYPAQLQLGGLALGGELTGVRAGEQGVHHHHDRPAFDRLALLHQDL